MANTALCLHRRSCELDPTPADPELSGGTHHFAPLSWGTQIAERGFRDHNHSQPHLSGNLILQWFLLMPMPQGETSFLLQRGCLFSSPQHNHSHLSHYPQPTVTRMSVTHSSPFPMQQAGGLLMSPGIINSLHNHTCDRRTSAFLLIT